jgi:hypothetical protein
MIYKHGGMWFWRVGKLGGTFYVARKHPKVKSTRGKAMLKCAA